MFRLHIENLETLRDPIIFSECYVWFLYTCFNSSSRIHSLLPLASPPFLSVYPHCTSPPPPHPAGPGAGRQGGRGRRAPPAALLCRLGPGLGAPSVLGKPCWARVCPMGAALQGLLGVPRGAGDRPHRTFCSALHSRHPGPPGLGGNWGEMNAV